MTQEVLWEPYILVNKILSIVHLHIKNVQLLCYGQIGRKKISLIFSMLNVVTVDVIFAVANFHGFCQVNIFTVSKKWNSCIVLKINFMCTIFYGFLSTVKWWSRHVRSSLTFNMSPLLSTCTDTCISYRDIKYFTNCLHCTCSSNYL